MITGQLIFRETGTASPIDPDKKLMMVVGIIAVPNDCIIDGEHQYTVSGKERAGVVGLAVHTRTGTDMTIETCGQSLGGLVTRPIWRV